MTDNTQVNNGSGDLIRDIDRGGAKTQVVQLDVGGQTAESLVNSNNPLPIEDIELQNPDTPAYVNIIGDPSGDYAGVNIFEQALDNSSGQAFNVRVINPSPVDANGLPKISDAQQIIIPILAGFKYIIDTQGFNSVSIQVPTIAGNSITPTWSNDGVTYFAGSWIYESQAASGSISMSNILAGGAGINRSACIGRWLNITIPAGVTSTSTPMAVMLRNASMQTHIDVAAIGGLSVTNGGQDLNGRSAIAVGGGADNGLTPQSIRPVTIAGTDSGTPGINPTVASTNQIWQSTVRRLLTDNQGRIRITAETTTAGYNQPPAVGGAGGQVLAVQDISQYEGQGQIELLAQILQELKILNQQIYNLPLSGGGADAAPEEYRVDPSMFNLNS